jgi:twitching motility protein PilT
MRDYETIGLALTAAETGHLVFGTLHSNTAAKTIDRIIDVFPAAEKEMVRAMLASSIQGVISQTLLKKEGGGRVAAHEILVGTNAVRNLIRENQLAQVYSMIQTGARYGMQTMEDSINDLVAAGMVSEKTAKAYLRDTSDSSDDDVADIEPFDDVPENGDAPSVGAEDKQQPERKRPASPPPVTSTDDGGYSF